MTVTMNFNSVFNGEVDIKIKQLDLRMTLPKYCFPGDSGLDLFPLENFVLDYSETKLIKLGFALELPQGLEAQIRSRSGLSLKDQVVVTNSPATIDSNYRGELGVILSNLGKQAYLGSPHRAIAQLVIAPVIKANLILRDELDETERGTGGYGSTDKIKEKNKDKKNRTVIQTGEYNIHIGDTFNGLGEGLSF